MFDDFNKGLPLSEAWQFIAQTDLAEPTPT